MGPIGVSLDIRSGAGHLDDAVLVEKLGYSTIWIPGGELTTLDPLRDVIQATELIPVGSAIIPARVHSPDDVLAFRQEIEAKNPGRLITGLGGAPGRYPLHTMNAYLDQLDNADPAIPPSTRILSALGPRMLELSRDRAAGAIPLLVTPEFTAHARQTLGDQATLAIMEYVVLESDPHLARATVRDPISFLVQVSGYPANLRRMGFTDDDIAGTSDRLLDGLVAWGDVDMVAARVRQHLDAGADQVVLVVRPTDAAAVPHEQWRALAEALIDQ
ncbi:TIGR03620 family F420-dependent LLM class oxidoreductase [Tamaricihabitans halophyticus]|uniref:TIGR03620 family F420-dependent LLM class oxidoreductase n=1 Tax=Tamaricihabitans halophyticus TaxID=1262583 RepID=UPI001FB39B21|nr:TIGR03620 family F420-dependent LLM class oxidoreductase [Tamaricihabitans halophyticus]